MSFKFEIPVPTKLLSVVSQFSVIKCSKTGNVKVEFVGRSTFPHYLMYFELRNIPLTMLYQMLIVYAAAKYATRVRVIAKSENEPQKY